MKKILTMLVFAAVLGLVMSSVSAADNITDDVISIENNDINEIVNVNEADSIENNPVSLNDDCNLSVSEYDDALNEGSYLKKGPSGYIDSDDMTITYKNLIGYSVRLVGGSPLGESVGFIIYKGDSGTHIGNYYTTADSNGYAYLNEDLKPDTYWIQMVSDNYGSVYNTITVKSNGYSNAKIDITDTYYKYSGGDVIFHWEGYLNGYFNIYKGSNLIHKKQIYPDASGVNTDGDFSEYVYLTKKLSIGSYTVKITANNGKVIKQASFKVTKMPTYVYCPNVKYTSGGTKYITAKVYDKIEEDWASGTVQFKINGKTYKVKLKSGEAKVKIKLPSNSKTYTCKASLIENSKYKSSTKTFKIRVKNAKTTKKTTTKTTKKSTTKTKSSTHIVKAGKYKGKLTNQQYKKLKTAYNKDKYAIVTIKSSNYKYCKISITYKNGYDAQAMKSYKKGFYAWVWDTRYGMDGTKIINKKISI